MTQLRMRLRWLPTLIAAVAVYLVMLTTLRSCSADPVHPIAIRADSLPAAAFARREAFLRRQLGDSANALNRLRRQLAGVQVRPPQRVTVYDTVITPPDTVLLAVVLGAEGKLEADAGVRVDSAGGVRPQTSVYDVSRCDGGWTLAADGRVACDRARLGHLQAFGRIGVATAVDPRGRPPSIEPRAAVGLRWTPCLRCGFAAELRGESDGSLVVQVERSVRIW